MENPIFNVHLVDLLYMNDNNIFGTMNIDDYTCLLGTKGSNYRRNNINLKIGNTSSTIGSVMNSAIFVPTTLVI